MLVTTNSITWQQLDALMLVDVAETTEVSIRKGEEQLLRFGASRRAAGLSVSPTATDPVRWCDSGNSMKYTFLLARQILAIKFFINSLENYIVTFPFTLERPESVKAGSWQTAAAQPDHLTQRAAV